MSFAREIAEWLLVAFAALLIVIGIEWLRGNGVPDDVWTVPLGAFRAQFVYRVFPVLIGQR